MNLVLGFVNHQKTHVSCAIVCTPKAAHTTAKLRSNDSISTTSLPVAAVVLPAAAGASSDMLGAVSGAVERLGAQHGGRSSMASAAS